MQLLTKNMKTEIYADYFTAETSPDDFGFGRVFEGLSRASRLRRATRVFEALGKARRQFTLPQVELKPAALAIKQERIHPA